MNWEHKDKTLQQRISTHERYGKFEINNWILKQIDLKPNEHILDIGCGNGKQLREFAKITAYVEGIDVSESLLTEAALKLKEYGLAANLKIASADEKLPYEDGTFDAASCCFSIYYYKNIQFTLNEINRVLKPGGRLFVAAPTRKNISELVSLTTIKTPYIKRTECEIIPLLFDNFQKITLNIFQNPIFFPDIESFMDYYNSALAFRTLSQTDKRSITSKVESEVNNRGYFMMTKSVYGILCGKP